MTVLESIADTFSSLGSGLNRKTVREMTELVSHRGPAIVLENRHLAAIVTGLGLEDLAETFLNEALAAIEGTP